MMTDISKETIMQGRREGKTVSLKYEIEDGAKILQWTAVGEEQWTTIGLDTIICLSREHELLYTIDHEDSENKQATTVLDSISQLEAAPEELLQDFSLPASSFLQDAVQHKQSSLQIIVSIASGTRRAQSFSTQVLLPLLQRFNIAYTLHETTSESHVFDLAKDRFLTAANEGVEQRIVLLSGDGGLVDILNALRTAPHTANYLNPSIALIPMGTGNALANSTDVANDRTHGLRTLVRGQPRELPSFKVTFSSGARFLADEARKEEQISQVNGTSTAYGCVVCSWGLHAALVADSDTREYRKYGSDRFKMAAKEALYPSDGSQPHAYQGKISIIPLGATNDHWKTIDRQSHGYVLSAPVSHREAGFNISPASQPFDAVLRLVHFGAMSGDEAMGIMGKAYQSGAHVRDERVSYEAVQALRIEFDEEDAHWRRVCIDGKIARIEQGGWIEVRSEAHSGVNVVAM